MKIKMTLLCILYGALAFAGEPLEKTLTSINRGVFTFSYIRINRNDKTEWELRQVPSGELILRLTHNKTDADYSIYTYSNLIDVMREGNQAGVLLSLDVGLLILSAFRQSTVLGRKPGDKLFWEPRGLARTQLPLSWTASIQSR